MMHPCPFVLGSVAFGSQSPCQRVGACVTCCFILPAAGLDAERQPCMLVWRAWSMVGRLTQLGQRDAEVLRCCGLRASIEVGEVDLEGGNDGYLHGTRLETEGVAPGVVASSGVDLASWVMGSCRRVSSGSSLPRWAELGSCFFR
ncbi:hypothetical protein BRADI_1g69824v3 [Brachypodium distachyon]|uniref:Uncharacterized protein n=1 Tax=Brachypodium distachyon TaxID=15368 RepID=A0A2K2DUB9_BRADI|nr:hypothetical protein BRADI_1g69824v3 [Brachypodium distachyon]